MDTPLFCHAPESFLSIKPLSLGNYFYQAKAKAMGVDQIRERLHLRIEQADEKMLQVLDELAESLFKNYQSDALEQARQERIAAYEEKLKPMTKEELVARVLASQADIEAGRIHDLEEVKRTLGL